MRSSFGRKPASRNSRTSRAACALVQVYLPGPRISSGGRMPSTKIIVRNDGPLRVEGEIELVDMQGQPYGLAGRTAIALCRCGHSANKPFCDGSHKAAGFQDQQQARELPPPKPQV